MRRFNRIFCGLVAVSMLTSCATMSEEDKAAISGIVGGIAGTLLAKELGASDWQAVLAGVALAYAGFELGKHLSRTDQVAVRQETATVLATAGDGETVTWESEESSATATITARDSRQQTREIEILRDNRIDAPPGLEIIGRPFVSVGSNVNLRTGPSTSAPVVGKLAKGDVVNAIGKVEDEPWIMIGRTNIAMGYVHSSLVAEQDESINNQVPTIHGTFELDEVDLAEVNKEANATFEIDEFEVVGDSFVVDTDCRTVDIEIVSDEGAETQSIDACRSLDGSWEKV